MIQIDIFLQIFPLSDLSRPIGVLNAAVPTQLGGNQAAVTSFAVMQDCSQFALGYSNGAIVLYTINSGHFGRERDASFSNSFSSIVLLPFHSTPVSSMHFAELPVQQQQPQASYSSQRRPIRLFVTFEASRKERDSSLSTGGRESVAPLKAPEESSVFGNEVDNAGILVFDTSTANGMLVLSSSSVKVLDDRGANAHCSTFIRGTCELVVGRNEAIYNYSVDDRGAAMAVPGEKLCVSAAGRYTLIASIDDKVAAEAVSGVGATKPRRPVLNIFDLKNKIICGTAKKYQLPMNEKVLLALSDISSTGTSSLYHCRKRNTIYSFRNCVCRNFSIVQCYQIQGKGLPALSSTRWI